ncbi:MAG: hypothetical protein V4519_01410 [Patescibacteria group bacterium]
MEKKTTHKGSTVGEKVAAGLGLAALAAAAAGAIFLYGTDAGKKRRAQIKSWSLRMKGDVMDRMEKMKDWSEESYSDIVDTVAEKYKNLKNVDAGELSVIVADLKRHWKTIKKHVEGNTKKKPSAGAKAKAKPKAKKKVTDVEVVKEPKQE